MTFKNNRAPLLSIIKLYASFHHHTWIQTGFTIRKRLSWVVTSVTLTFDLWPWPFAWTSFLSLVITPENFLMIRWWEHSQKGVTDRQTDGRTDGRTDWTIHRAAWSQLKTIGRLYYATSSSMHHFIAMCEFKLELQSGNAQFGSKSTIFVSRVTSQFDVWPWKTIGHLFYATSSFMHHFVAIGEFKLQLQSGNAQSGSNRRFLEPCDLEIWRMTLKNNRAPLLCYFKLYASFHSHQWIQAGVTVWKSPIWVKFNAF